MKTKTTIFASSFIVQLLVMYFLGRYHQLGIYEYEEIAVNLLTRHSFICHRLGGVYYSIMTPLYPMLCAAVYFLTNFSHLAMLLVQITLVSSLSVIVYMIGDRIFNKETGLIGAILCIFHPGLIIYSTMKLHELSLVVFVFSLLILTILKFGHHITYKNSLFIGIVIGMAILTRANIVLFIPLFLIWLYMKNVFKTKKEYLCKSFFILFIVAITISPWIMRNYFVHHKFVFMQTPSVDFWVGNNNYATGTNYTKDGKQVIDLMPKDFLDNIYKADELTKDKIFKQEVYNFIIQHPYRFAGLFFKKFYYFWWFSPQTGIEYSKVYAVLYKIYYSVVFLFAAFGIFFAVRSKNIKVKENSILLLLFFLSVSVSQSMFYVEGRHRWAIEPMLLIFTANGIIYIKDKIMADSCKFLKT